MEIYIYKYIHMKISIYKIDKCNAPFFSFFLLILFGHSFFFFNKTFSSLWTLTASYCLMVFYHNWSKCKHTRSPDSSLVKLECEKFGMLNAQAGYVE